jgi:threonine/homoserine/homoserine lactone efflux protein
MTPFLKGVIIGLTFAILLGPGFFSLIQTSIHRGFRSGLLLASGIFLGDLLIIVLCYLGFSQFLGADPRQNVLFGVIGGIILIMFGTYTFTRRVHDPSTQQLKINTPRFYIYILKGFLLNLANPGVWFLWITVLVSISSSYGINTRAIFLFLAGTLGTVLSTDLLKCFVANAIKSKLNHHVMTWMNRIVGVILVGFGSYLLIAVLLNLRAG